MRKTILIALCIAAVLCGCAASGTAETTAAATEAAAATNAETTATEASAATGFSVTYRGTVITLGADMTPIYEALGEPTSYSEETSCAFEGLDKTYYYGSLYIQTNPNEDGDRIATVWFADDGVTTDEGVCIGSAVADVEAAYGADSFTDDTTCQIDRDGQRLLILFKDSMVSSIQYSLISQ